MALRTYFDFPSRTEKKKTCSLVSTFQGYRIETAKLHIWATSSPWNGTSGLPWPKESGWLFWRLFLIRNSLLPARVTYFGCLWILLCIPSCYCCGGGLKISRSQEIPRGQWMNNLECHYFFLCQISSCIFIPSNILSFSFFHSFFLSFL